MTAVKSYRAAAIIFNKAAVSWIRSSKSSRSTSRNYEYRPPSVLSHKSSVLYGSNEIVLTETFKGPFINFGLTVKDVRSSHRNDS